LDKRLAFNENAANYDQWRPTYTQKMFGHIIEYASVNSEKCVVEIGIGTGQATEPFLKTGCDLTAIELGQDLAKFSKEKFASYPNIKVENLPFEDYQCVEGSVDLVYSATAFHWISEETGYKKVFTMLKNGGTLALFWNRPFVDRDDDKLHQKIQMIYEKFGLGFDKRPIENDSARYAKIKATILSYGFTRLDFTLYHDTRCFAADEYVALLNTYSDHRSLPPDLKNKFEAEIRNAITCCGNKLYVYDTIDLYLSQKP
jgi:SAM-dependent methyltransferase